MKKLFWLCLVAAAPAFAQNYTITAPHLTMHVGDPVPPCPILVIDQSTGQSVGEGNTCSLVQAMPPAPSELRPLRRSAPTRSLFPGALLRQRAEVALRS
jgi:hypothetical protein